MYLLHRLLTRIVRAGELTVIAHDGTVSSYGAADPARAPVVIRLTDSRVPLAILTRGPLGVGEAYMDGRLVVEQGDILALMDLVYTNNRWEDGDGNPLKGPLRRAAARAARVWRTLNWARQSRRNVAHHYDLSEHLYDFFLDADRQYSCAYFTDPEGSLETAQRDKKAHIAAKLHLSPGQSVLDIGCGWGGLALYLHRAAGVDVLGITLSVEQLKIARARAEAAGVSAHVRFELIDYRHIEGRFDRIVSVGMFEHVGPPNYRTFFRKCRDLLAPDGVMLLHTIGRYGGPGATDGFTRKYIFPGGYIPALSEMLDATEAERLIVADVEALRMHYGLTTEQWYRRTTARRDEIVALYDERFFRMWQFYLAGATVTFRHGGMGNYQLQLLRDRRAVPMIRDYMHGDERRLRATDATQADQRAPEPAE